MLVTARKFNDLGVVEQQLAEGTQVERTPRELTAPEFALLPATDAFANDLAHLDVVRPEPAGETSAARRASGA